MGVAIAFNLLLLVWYIGALWLNSDRLIQGYERRHVDWSFGQLVADAYSMKRPLLPTPDQIGAELYKTIFATAVDSKRSLVYHAGITLSSTLLGFVFVITSYSIHYTKLYEGQPERVGGFDARKFDTQVSHAHLSSYNFV